MLGLYATFRTIVDFTSARLSRDEKGATAVEYGIMVALIAVVVIAAVTLIGTNLDLTFDKIAEKVKPAGA